MARRVLLGCLFLALLAPAPALADETSSRDLTGVYACEGQNPDGSAYSGRVEIVKWQDAYLVRWTIPSTSQVVGIGILRGDVLAVSYFGGSPAIVVYSVSADDRLDGKWTLVGADGAVFSETLTRMKAGQITPRDSGHGDPQTAPTKPARPVRGSGREVAL